MTQSDRHDVAVLRELAAQVAEIAAKPVQEERRRLWTAHHSLQPTRPLVLSTFGMWNVWCREVFGDQNLKCKDPFYRERERTLRMRLFQDSTGDDSIQEPWFTERAAVRGEWGKLWGVTETFQMPGVEGGAWKFDPPIRDWSDAAKLRPTPHEVDETATRQSVARVEDAIGDLLPIDVSRTPAYHGFLADISTTIARLRGLENLMLDMYEHPAELHRLMSFMRDAILANNQAAEDAGHYTLTSGSNQSMCYAGELERPRPNSGPRLRKALWGFCAAQEYTLISPAFHREFLWQYQVPIMRHYGLVHYGCCEDLTAKIDMLRELPNLRSIAVTPCANLAANAKQIGTDYCISWRPNPTDMVCAGWDEARIRRIIGEGIAVCRGQRLHIHLKDVETVQGESDRLARWVRLVREVASAG